VFALWLNAEAESKRATIKVNGQRKDKLDVEKRIIKISLFNGESRFDVDAN
jgi:hypothetical protein